MKDLVGNVIVLGIGVMYMYDKVRCRIVMA